MVITIIYIQMETANDISIGEVPSRTEDIRGIRERTSMAQSTKRNEIQDA